MCTIHCGKYIMHTHIYYAIQRSYYTLYYTHIPYFNAFKASHKTTIILWGICTSIGPPSLVKLMCSWNCCLFNVITSWNYISQKWLFPRVNQCANIFFITFKIIIWSVIILIATFTDNIMSRATKKTVSLVYTFICAWCTSVVTCCLL